MKRTALKALSLAAALLMVIGATAGCQSSAAPTQAPTTAAATAAPTTEASATVEATPSVPSYLSDTSPITFDWYVDCSWYTNAKWGVDATSKYITKKTGVTLNIILPTGNEAEKKNLMIATGEVPDFVSMGQWENARTQLVGAGLVYSLNELADKYAKDFWDVTTPSTVGWFAEEDGKIYGYPNCNTPLERMDLPENQAQMLSYIGFSVRKDMYEAIGSPDMTTPEGFLAALQAVKEKFPTVDGKEMIPFYPGYEFTDTGNAGIEDNLCELLNIPLADSNGKLINRLTSPDMITWLKTLRKANELGLMPKEVYIDKSPQIIDALNAGRAFSTLYAVNTIVNGVNGVLAPKDPNSIFIQIEGPQNSKKEKAQFRAGGLSGWLWTTISKKNKNPERAIKFMQYWLSVEGQGDFWLGDPSFCRNADGTPKSGLKEQKVTDNNSFSSTYGCRDTYLMLIDLSITSRWDSAVFPDYAKQYYAFQNGRFKDTTEQGNTAPAGDSPAGIELQKSRSSWGTLLPKMLLAASDDEFDKYMAEYKAVDDAASLVYLPIMQPKYEANLKKLGK